MCPTPVSAAAWLVVLLTGAAASAWSVPPARVGGPPRREPYTLEHALTLRTFSGLSWSRDGRRLAFVVAEQDTTENTINQDLWLWQAGDTARRLTRHPMTDWSPSFSPGGDTIAFVSSRAAGDEAKPGIHLLSLRGGEPWAFGTYDEAINEVTWSPDGRWLAYVRPDTLPKRVREWQKKKWDQVVEDERLQYPHLWVVEVATGRQRRLTGGAHWVWNPRWAPDSRAIAFLTSPTGKP
ncbi:MAG: TolB family protein, partial [Candidatus Eiseniibacteriota bacterium]